MIRRAAIAGCLLMWGPNGAAQPQNRQGFIVGEVRDSAGSAIPSVDISVENTRHHAALDSAGRFLIKDVPPGEYSLRVRSIGIQSLTRPLGGVSGRRVRRLTSTGDAKWWSW